MLSATEVFCIGDQPFVEGSIEHETGDVCGINAVPEELARMSFLASIVLRPSLLRRAWHMRSSSSFGLRVSLLSTAWRIRSSIWLVIEECAISLDRQLAAVAQP